MNISQNTDKILVNSLMKCSYH